MPQPSAHRLLREDRGCGDSSKEDGPVFPLLHRPCSWWRGRRKDKYGAGGSDMGGYGFAPVAIAVLPCWINPGVRGGAGGVRGGNVP